VCMCVYVQRMEVRVNCLVNCLVNYLVSDVQSENGEARTGGFN